ncbi:hypothetical protein Tco_0920650 [Tanacetum coccineum]
MRIKSVNDGVFKREAHILTFLDIQISIRPDDVERASSVVDGRVPSRTGTAQMQSPEWLIALLFCGLCSSVIIMEFPNGILYFLLENHVILSLFRCAPFAAMGNMLCSGYVSVAFVSYCCY